MNKLIIMRGSPGSGKSTLLAKHGLAYHTVSPDAARLVLSGPELDATGAFGISQQHNSEAWKMAMTVLEQRMRRGETLAFDAVFDRQSDLKQLLELAKKRHYEVLVVNLFTVPKERALAQNRSRGEPKSVPQFVVERSYANFENDLKADLAVQEVLWQEDGSHDSEIKAFLHVPIVDLSAYRAVVHLSDNQGCYRVMFENDSPVKNGLRDDTFYIHHGDLVDRGTEHADVVRWAAENLRNHDNFRLLRGNHELHLIRYFDGEAAVSKEFERQTQPNLVRNQTMKEDLQIIVEKAIDVFTYRHDGIEVLCTHAGLPSWPQRLDLVSGEQYQKGPGFYETDVDAAFTNWSLSNEALTTKVVYQVHGHRNSQMLPVMAGVRSINLEGQVEFGGHMRFAELKNNVFSTTEIRNRVYRTLAEIETINLSNENPHRPRPGTLPTPQWIKRGHAVEPTISQEMIDSMRSHKAIAERRSEVLPHVSAFNFTHDAFESKYWDTLSLRARGMFIDIESNHIVARSYEKFFNWGERPDTSPEYLQEVLTFPVTAYRKENGFLGILGYDRKTDSLIITSKSKMDSPFSGWLAEILGAKIGASGKEKIMRYLRDAGASAVFEVIDPVRDPHMIEYTEPNIVLLDVVARDLRFQKLSYEDLQKVGRVLGVDVKQRTTTFKNWHDLVAFVTRVKTDEKFRERGGYVEGYVLEDSMQRIVKVKSAYYSFWKRMRSLKDQVVSSRSSQKLVLAPKSPAEAGFLEFCLRQPTEALTQSIIDLRRAYEDDPNQTIAGETPVVEQKPKYDGFVKGMAAVAAQIREGRAKYLSVRKMLDSVEADADKLAAVRDLEEYRVVVDFANFDHALPAEGVS